MRYPAPASAPMLRRPPVIPSNRATLGVAPPVYHAMGMPGAQQSPFIPAAHLQPLPAYSNPTQNQQVQLAGLQRGQLNLDPAITAAMGDPAAIMHARAQQYAQHRLAQLQALAPQLSPELQAMMGGQSQLDPAAAWRAISGAFATFARGQGYTDPRQMLQLGRLNRGQRGGY